MPFEKGNPGGALSAGVPKPWSHETRKAARSLAMAVRDGVKPDEVVAWLVQVWQGRDPLTNEIVPLESRERALKLLLDRGWGQAAQMLVVEGEVRQEITAATPAPDRPTMTLDEINARRAALRAALPGGSVVIDVAPGVPVLEQGKP